MSPLAPCTACGAHHRLDEAACPHCGHAAPTRGARPGLRSGAALLLALTAGGCDFGRDVALYGANVVDTGGHEDEDGDGYEASVDCDDSDEAVHPDAEETPGDGVDSNCDGQDDT